MLDNQGSKKMNCMHPRIPRNFTLFAPIVLIASLDSCSDSSTDGNNASQPGEGPSGQWCLVCQGRQKSAFCRPVQGCERHIKEGDDGCTGQKDGTFDRRSALRSSFARLLWCCTARSRSSTTPYVQRARSLLLAIAIMNMEI